MKSWNSRKFVECISKHKDVRPLLSGKLYCSIAIIIAIAMTPTLPAHAEELSATTFMKHIDSLRPIALQGGPNDVTFFGPVYPDGLSQASQCDDGCPQPGMIILYAKPGADSSYYGTFLPFVWDVAEGNRILSLVDLNYKDVYENEGFEFAGSDENSRSGALKAVVFYQANFDSKPVTLVFIGALDPSDQMSGELSRRAKLSILEFTRFRIKGSIHAQFRPIFSVTTKSRYGNADVALWSVFGLPDVITK